VGLLDDVRRHCAEVAGGARSVRIDTSRFPAAEPGPAPGLDPYLHPLELGPEARAAWVLQWDAINFGSGWFPELRKRPGRSGSVSITLALTEYVRSGDGPWTAAELRSLDAATVAAALGQDPAHELMGLYTQALRDLGGWLGRREALAAIAEAEGSAERLATQLAEGMPFYRDTGFYKRAQLTPSDLALAGVAEFRDLGALTVFADNLVPHVLRLDGVLVYDPALAARIDAGEPLAAGSPEEQEIRGCAVHACETLARATGIPARELDARLWNRGQAAEYKAVRRHRTRTVYY
jgi:hypothetical protein